MPYHRETLDARSYQELAVRKVLWLLRSEVRTLLVAPTGAGKTCMGCMVAAETDGVIWWIVHTQDLVLQTAEKLRSYGLRCGVIAAGQEVDPFARIQVLSVQTMVARQLDGRADLVILDEAHHYLAEQWRAAYERTRARKVLGLTATPERADGQALGDIFGELVVAAHYSELTRGGYLVPLRILRPSRELSRGLALKSTDSYRKHAEGRQGFIYERSVELAKKTALEATEQGFPSACIEANTPPEERQASLARFAAGELRLLTNQRVLTEGVDIPQASVCIWAKNFSHLSGALQSAGRVLRPAPGKTEALLLDLPGLTHRAGWIPTEDKEYSLTGRGIKRSESALALHVCMSCGMTHESGARCPRCGAEPERKLQKPLRIYNEALVPVYAGAQTPDWAKRAELERLQMVARERKLSVGWTAIEYEKLFGERPDLNAVVPGDQKKLQFQKLLEQATLKGYAKGWAMHRYKVMFGAFPPRSWLHSCAAAVVRDAQWRDE